MGSEYIAEFQGKFRFLSNFAPCEIEHEGLRYLSTESAYQAAKTTDLQVRVGFCSLAPGKAKRASKLVKLRNDWDDVKLQVMYELNKQKYVKNAEYRTLLEATDNLHIQEGNSWGDTYWGVCRGAGQNHLGKILMRIRRELRVEKD